jgi:hypothetical protein
VDEAVTAFGGKAELLLAVHHRWQTNLLARLDQVLEEGADDLHAAVRRAVEQQSRALPGFAGLLSEHAHDPVLAHARGTLSEYVAQACPCGRPHPLVVPPRRTRSTAGRASLRAIAARWERRLRHAGGPCPVTRLVLPRT